MIKQTVRFKATPQEVYECLMDAKKHAAFTGSDAEIQNHVGGKFSVWEGYATGKNLELIPGKKIVQEWRADDWPEGVSSTLTMQLKPERGGTELTLIHEGVPSDFEKDVSQGWKDYYWKPLKEYLNKNL